MDAQRGHKRRTRRGKRKSKASGGHAAHETAKAHIAAAQAATDPKKAHAHLFKAISALKKC